jgi:hypothetical protein
MNKKLLLLLFLSCLSSGLTFGQIPNPGFENWTAGNPDGWLTNNAAPIYTTIIQSTSSHSGTYAVQGTVASYMGISISPVLLSGTDGQGFPYTDHPGSFHGYYKLTSVGGDYVVGYVILIKNGQEIGAGAFQMMPPAASYTEFATDITWFVADNPDSAAIGIVLTNDGDSIHVGTTFYLDDLSFSNSTEVKGMDNSPFRFELAQNYPNPFNPSTTINYSIPKQSFVSLKIYNLLGQEVATLVNEEKSAGNYKVNFSTSLIGSYFASGVYVYRLAAGDLVQTKKMMLLK